MLGSQETYKDHKNATWFTAMNEMPLLVQTKLNNNQGYPWQKHSIQEGTKDSELQSFMTTIRGRERSWICKSGGETATLMLMFPIYREQVSVRVATRSHLCEHLLLAGIELVALGSTSERAGHTRNSTIRLNSCKIMRQFSSFFFL